MVRVTAMISVDDLVEALISDNPPLLLDVRFNLTGPPAVREYQEGHLTGAVFVDLDTELAGPPGPDGRHPLPSAAVVQAAMRRAGLDADRDVVVYDRGEMIPAARAWWILRYFGHERVRVLDGGITAWLAAGQPATTSVPEPADGSVTLSPGHLPVLDVDEAAAFPARGTLVDVRAPERYRGDAEPIDPVGGHIPGAVNLPLTGNLRPDGGMLAVADLRARFAAAGLDSSEPVAAYCGSGVSAAQMVLAMHLAGIPASLFVGSWSNWIADQSRPIATGSTPAGEPG
jgi:thiosulfate/3-mercaptopyruvate sulfurtransferase